MSRSSREPLPKGAGNGAGRVGLVFIDVDGTLVGSSGIVSDETWLAAERARRAGIRLAISSGRPAFGVSRGYAERLDAVGWHCFQNGSSVVDLGSGRSSSALIAPAIVRRLVERARATGYALELYSDDDYVVESTSARARDHASLLGVPFRARSFEALASPLVRAQWLLSHAEAEVILAEPHDGLVVSPSSSPVMPDTHFINLTPAGVDKSTAVRSVAAEYGLPLGRVMYVGDGGNDAVAMRIVGHPVAMANGEPEALAAATRIVAHVDESGLAEALELALEL